MIKRLTAAICLMARKEDKDLLDSIDAAIDAMNVETPNWRTELYNEYYSSPSKNNDFTAEEQEYPAALKSNGAVIRAVMNPEGTPYSWYDGEEAHGIAADIFAATADRFGLAYEIVPVATVVVGQYSAEIIQSNMETGTEENVVRYFYTHPEVSGVILIVAVAALMFLALYGGHYPCCLMRRQDGSKTRQPPGQDPASSSDVQAEDYPSNHERLTIKSQDPK